MAALLGDWQLGESGLELDEGSPPRSDELDRTLRSPILGRQLEQLLEDGMHESPSSSRWTGRPGEPVDRPEAVEQRTLLEVGRPARGEGWGHDRRVCAGTDSGQSSGS